MREIIPSIISDTIGEIRKKIAAVSGMVDWVQIDVADGIFAFPSRWPYASGSISELREVADIGPAIEVHMMVQDPGKNIDEWIKSGAKRLLVHYESQPDIMDVVSVIEKAGIEAGLVFNLGIDLKVAAEVIRRVKLLQLMSIAGIGGYGHVFHDSVLERIKYVLEVNPTADVHVDGGITIDAAKKVFDVGATGVIVGSRIFGVGDVSAAVSEYKQLI